MKTIFETGATTHAVNELILFTDNTRELAEKRDSIYNSVESDDCGAYLNDRFANVLAPAAIKAYSKEVSPIRLSLSQVLEYATIYEEDYKNWKKEKNLHK